MMKKRRNKRSSTKTYFCTPSVLIALSLLSTLGTHAFSRVSSLLNPTLKANVGLHSSYRSSLFKATEGNTNENEDEAEKLKQKAKDLRQQILDMESKLGDRAPRSIEQPPVPEEEEEKEVEMTLKNKSVLVIGANGRVGSKVCRYLLRNFPQTNVVAAVHTVGENSSRGYGRLSYEVGAEDGQGYIGAAWSEDREAYYEYTDDMKDYNLQNLRVVEVELLDPAQCVTITEDIDSVVWCATDFNGNTPRSISSLDAAFLFRAILNPVKGRVEVEGLRNILGGLKKGKTNSRWESERSGDSVEPRVNKSDPISFVHLSVAEDALPDFETTMGRFKDIKRQGDDMVMSEFPSLTYSVLQMSRYEDNFVDESLAIKMDNGDIETSQEDKSRRRINRRDAARAVADALVDRSLVGKKVEVWTELRG